MIKRIISKNNRLITIICTKTNFKISNYLSSQIILTQLITIFNIPHHRFKIPPKILIHNGINLAAFIMIRI
jgi:hypothetical protein